MIYVLCDDGYRQGAKSGLVASSSLAHASRLRSIGASTIEPKDSSEQNALTYHNQCCKTALNK